MTKQNLRLVIAATFAAGMVLTSASAFAQKAPNDGGLAPEPKGQIDNVAPAAKPAAPYYGRSANDGGAGPQPTATQISAAERQNKASQPTGAPHMGRPLNDGGQ